MFFCCLPIYPDTKTFKFNNAVSWLWNKELHLVLHDMTAASRQVLPPVPVLLQLISTYKSFTGTLLKPLSWSIQRKKPIKVFKDLHKPCKFINICTSQPCTCYWWCKVLYMYVYFILLIDGIHVLHTGASVTEWLRSLTSGYMPNTTSIGLAAWYRYGKVLKYCPKWWGGVSSVCLLYLTRILVCYSSQRHSMINHYMIAVSLILVIWT